MGLPLIGDLVDGLFGIGGKLIKDKDQLEKFKHEVNMTVLNSSLAQLEVNKQEAAHKSLFVAGWRPFVGWVCGVGLAYSVIVRDFLIWAGTIWVDNFQAPPEIDDTSLTTILLGMLGMGGLRTYEKFKGVNREK